MYIAIDIGGTKTLLSLFSERGKLITKLKIKSLKNPDEYARLLKRTIPKILPLRRKSIHAVTISYPGVLENGHPKVAPNLPDWNGEELEACIKNLFKNNRVNCPIYFKNDADLGAFYECKNLKGKTLYLTFGTGIGGGLVKNGKILKESEHFEPGHNRYTYKGKTEEWEKISSSRAIRAANNDLDVTKITKKSALDDVACRISLGLTDLIKSQKPDQIVLSGPIATILPSFLPTLEKLLETSLKTGNVPPIYQAEHPQESVIYGAYLYGKSQNS